MNLVFANSDEIPMHFTHFFPPQILQHNLHVNAPIQLARTGSSANSRSDQAPLEGP